MIGEYSTCIPEADMGEYRINDIDGDTLLVKCSEVVAIQEHSLCPIEEDQEDEAQACLSTRSFAHMDAVLSD